MGFDTLLGNEQLKQNLTTALSRGHHAHFYLLCGPAGSGKHTLAKLLSAALMCSEAERPCLRCQACRKVLGGLHPDVITVEDPEHKTVPVKLVRQYRDDMFIRPNEGNKKIYLFPQALGIEGQNALLKILEEPPEYGVYLLMTDNAEQLLPTVRSRCVELKLQPLPSAQLKTVLHREFPQAADQQLEAAVLRSGGYLGQARQLLQSGEADATQHGEFVRAFGSRDGLLLAQVLLPMEKYKRDALIDTLQQWLQLLEGAMACRGGLEAPSQLSAQLAESCNAARLNAAVQELKNGMEYARGNVSVAAICGHLLWALR